MNDQQQQQWAQAIENARQQAQPKPSCIYVLVIFVSEVKYHIYFLKFELSAGSPLGSIARIFQNMYDIFPHSLK